MTAYWIATWTVIGAYTVAAVAALVKHRAWLRREREEGRL